MIEIKAGQVWVPTRQGSRAKPRTVVWAGIKPPKLPWIDYPTVGFVRDPAKPVFPETGHDSWLSERGFRSWVRKHNVVLQTPK